MTPKSHLPRNRFKCSMDEIMIGKRLFTFGHTVYKCVAYPSSSSKLDTLAALSLATRTPA